MNQNNAPGAATTRIPPYYREEEWDRLARLYDPFVKLVSVAFGGEHRFRKHLVEMVNPGEEDLVMDVCCGTGTLTSLLAGKAGPRGRVVGVDLSPQMLRIAQAKARDTAATFERANTEHLPFRCEAFDKACISLGLHEMPQAARLNTLSEIRRVLKEGGGLFVLDYHLPPRLWLRSAIRLFLRLFEEEPARQMVMGGCLVDEIRQAGLEVAGQRLLYDGSVQLIWSTKPQGKEGHQDG